MFIQYKLHTSVPHGLQSSEYSYASDTSTQIEWKHSITRWLSIINAIYGAINELMGDLVTIDGV